MYYKVDEERGGAGKGSDDDEEAGGRVEGGGKTSSTRCDQTLTQPLRSWDPDTGGGRSGGVSGR